MIDRFCISGCGKRVVARGLADRCYRIASSLVKSGRTTWADLEMSGRALPSRASRPTRRQFFEEVLQNKTAKKLKLEEIKPQMRVTYTPTHTEGTVSSKNDRYVFVKFDGQPTSQPCKLDDLVEALEK